jgi:hypothetical protein
VAESKKGVKPLNKLYKNYDECFASLKKIETHDEAQNNCVEAFYPSKTETSTNKGDVNKDLQYCKELIDRGISDRNIERCEKIQKELEASDGSSKNQEKVHYKEKYGGDLEACIKGVESEMRNIGYGEGEASSLCKKRKSEWGQLN